MRSTQLLPLMAVLTVYSYAQSSVTSTTVGPDGTSTIYYSICPSATSTTVTLSGTTTADGYPVITAEPHPITMTGDDGRETIYNIETTILPHLCPGGVCGATYTLYEECPCTAGPKTVTIDECPPGFTTSVVACDVCAASGGPSSVTVTTPVAHGPYATVTPAMGPAGNGATPIAQPAAAGTVSAAVGTAPATPPSNAGTDSGSGSGSGSGSNAAAPAGSSSDSSTVASGAGAGPAAAAAAAAGAGAGGAAGAGPDTGSTSPIAPANNPGSAISTSGTLVNATYTGPSITPYHGAAADRLTTSFSAILMVLAAMLML